MILRKETEISIINYFIIAIYHCLIRMNDTPQGDGNYLPNINHSLTEILIR